jgi:glutamyl-tRNA reductase
MRALGHVGKAKRASLAEQEAGANLNGRRCEAERAELIIRDELSHLREWQRAIATAPDVRALWAQADGIRQRELAELDRKSGGLSTEARRQLDAVTRSLVKKLLHEPTQRLRALDDQDEGLRHLESLRYLFGLAAADPRLAEPECTQTAAVAASSELNGAHGAPEASRR